METRLIRADQLRRGHELLIELRGQPTRYRVEQVERDGMIVRYLARPVSRTGRLWNGRAVRELPPQQLIEIIRR